MRVYDSVTELIGGTPLVRMHTIEKELGLDCTLLAKLECVNPGGSCKDRAALGMIRDAERRGVLKPGGTIIEPTSGNTGVALAMLAAAGGYRAIFVMPENMSRERRQLLQAYGARVILTGAAQGMAGAVAAARALQRKTPGSFMPGQFENPANAQAHYDTTGPEIWRDAAGMMDAFVAGVGTGGSVTGAGRYLKEKNPRLLVAAAEPLDSPVLSGGAPGMHALQGLGAGFVPPALDRSVIDRVIPVATEEAFFMSRLLARREGLLCGISSGAALHAAVTIGREAAGKVIVALLPDTGERYLSTALFEA